MATASLEADPALEELRFKLVPARLSEEDFWRCYFWHVANIKCDLLNDFATANKVKRDAVLADEKALSTEVPSNGNGEPPAGGEAPAFDHFELDEEFERLVGGLDD